MNLPNAITLSRIPLTFVIGGLVYCEWRGAASLAFVLFILAAVGDWLDGYLARKRGQVSNFGKFMDALSDKILVLGLVIVLVDKHRIPAMLAVLTLCRDFLVTGMRMVAASKGIIVAADKGGKSKTVTQLIALGFFLAAPMVGNDGSHFAHTDFTDAAVVMDRIGLWIFVAGTLLSVWSGWRYTARYGRVVFAEDGPPAQ